MHENTGIIKQGIRYKSDTINSNQWIIAVVLFVVVVFSGAASIIYSSPFPFFLTLASLLLVPFVFILTPTITPGVILGAHIFSRLVLDSIPGITYKNIVGGLSIMKIYSTGTIAFGLLYLLYKKEIKLDWLLVLFIMVLFSLLPPTIYHQTWSAFLESVLKWIYLWLIITFTKLSLNSGDFKRFSVVILVLYLYPILNFLYSVASGRADCAEGLCRFIGTYDHQGIFSFILLTIIPVALYLVIIEKRIISKFLYAVVLLLAHIGIYSSSHRTVWIALALYWAIFLLSFLRKISPIKKIFLIFTASVAIGYLLIPGSYINDKMGERLAPLINLLQEPYEYLDLSSSEAYRTITGEPYVSETKENLLLSGRIGDWKALLIAYGDAPIEEKVLGMGVGMDKEIMARHKWGAAFDAHNIYVQTLVETGILGLMALLCLILIISLKLIPKIKQHSLPIIIAMPIFFSYIIGGLAGNLLDNLRAVLCVGLYLGIALYHQDSHTHVRKQLLHGCGED